MGARGDRVPHAAARDPRAVAAAPAAACLTVGLAGRCDEQAPDRRVHDVVRDVEQPGVRRRVAEATIQLGRNLHASPSFLRRRRIPDDAACRAASADDPSAAPISA